MQDLKGMTEREAAKILGKSSFTMAKWRQAGKGPKFARIGGTIRYFREELEAYVTARTVTPQEEKADDA